MPYTSTDRVGVDHIEWQRGLGFYKDELVIMQDRLQEIVQKNNKPAINREVEHFQNQLIVQRNTIDQLHHELQLYQDRLGADAHQHQGRVAVGLLGTREQLRESYDSFEKVMNTLRHEFNAFLARTL